MGILTEANSAFDIASMKLNAITEAANRQYNINLREAELKVMLEHGTDDWQPHQHLSFGRAGGFFRLSAPDVAADASCGRGFVCLAVASFRPEIARTDCRVAA